eukprot:4064224-Lingulodinium_polyedra.AAC.1
MRAWYVARSRLRRAIGLSLARRFQEWRSTVGSTFLWGAQGWCLQASQAQRIVSFELQCLREVVGKKRRPFEPWLSWLKRTTRATRRLLGDL